MRASEAEEVRGKLDAIRLELMVLCDAFDALAQYVDYLDGVERFEEGDF